jgi:hypothetical protein
MSSTALKIESKSLSVASLIIISPAHIFEHNNDYMDPHKTSLSPFKKMLHRQKILKVPNTTRISRSSKFSGIPQVALNRSILLHAYRSLSFQDTGFCYE